MTGQAATEILGRPALARSFGGHVSHTNGKIFNRVLLALPAEIREHVLCACRPVELPFGHVIYRTGAALEYAYFVNVGLVCLLKSMRDGRTVEVGTVGAEGVVGVDAAFDNDSAHADFVVQVPLSAQRISCSVLQRQMAKHPAFRGMLTKYLFLHREQLAQASACNRLHSLEQRCCQWLLVTHDNVLSDDFQLTHEFLASLLGVQRPSLSLLANELQKRGLIRYSYGRVTILNRHAIEDVACECYGTLRRQIEVAFGPAHAAEPSQPQEIATA